MIDALIKWLLKLKVTSLDKKIQLEKVYGEAKVQAEKLRNELEAALKAIREKSQ